MRYEWRNNSVLCVHNLSAEPREVRIKLAAEDEAGCALVNLLSDEHSYPEGAAFIVSCSSHMATAGTACVAWTIC